MAWGSEVVASPQLTSITTYQYFTYAGSNVISLNPGETIDLWVKVDFPTTPTDHAIVGIFPSYDNGATYTDTPIYEQLIDKATDPNKVPLPPISNLKYFKVGVKRSGSTDTLASADSGFVKDGVSI